jgi:predicted metal-dependent peptidase
MILGDSLSKATKHLMLQQPFYGFYLMSMNKRWGTRVPTAGVSKNGINYQLDINTDFWSSLIPDWQSMILWHECLHVCFFHLERMSEFKDKKIMNIAMDVEINQYIWEDWLPLYMMSYTDYKAEHKAVIDRMRQEIKDGLMTKQEAAVEMRKIPPRGVYLKDFPELNLEPKMGCKYYYDKLMEAKDKEPGKGGSEALNDLIDQMDEGIHVVCDHDWEEFENMTEGEKKIFHAQVDYKLKEAAEQIKKSRGTIPAELADYLDGIDKKSPPKFNWKSYLRRFTGGSQQVYTKKLHRKYNKRFEDLPGLKIKPKKHVLLVIDTSGSVSNDELKEFYHEAYHIQKMGTQVTVMHCDAAISFVGPFTKEMINDKIAIFGRGGKLCAALSSNA